MKITPTAKLLHPLKDSFLQSQGDKSYEYGRRLGRNKFCDVLDPNNPGEHYHTAFMHKGKKLGCNCGDEIAVVDTVEELDRYYAADKLAVTKAVADAMVVAGADILEE